MDNKDKETAKQFYTLLVYSENVVGVLNQVTAVFTRRQVNIASLNVSASSLEGIHKYTITCWSAPDQIEKITKQIEKKIDVIKVKTFEEKDSISRELMLIKVKYNRNNRRDIMEICEMMKAEIVDVSSNLIMIQICDMPERINVMLDMLKSISIVEIARTGTVALPKCTEG